MIELPYGTHELRRMTGRHRVILRLHLAGWSGREIAQAVRMTPEWVYGVINSVEFQKECSRLNDMLDEEFVKREVEGELGDPVRQLLHDESMNNLLTLIDLRDDTNAKPEIRMRTAMDMLDRDGYNVVDKKKIDANLNLEKTVQDNISKAVADLSSGFMFDSEYVKTEVKKEKIEGV